MKLKTVPPVAKGEGRHRQRWQDGSRQGGEQGSQGRGEPGPRGPGEVVLLPQGSKAPDPEGKLVMIYAAFDV